jgi:hypothetical protein
LADRTKYQLSTTNKLLLYETILKPIWTYGIQLWGTASTSNIEILERFQSKVLRMIVDAPNSLIRRDLSCSTVEEEIRRYLQAVHIHSANGQLASKMGFKPKKSLVHVVMLPMFFWWTKVSKL